MWVERFVIVITSLHRDFVPSSWGMYYPTYLGLGDIVRQRGIVPDAAVSVHSLPPNDIHVRSARIGGGEGGARMSATQQLHGLMAEFLEPEQVVKAARYAHEQGYRCMDAYTPFPVEDLSEALGHKEPACRFIVLSGGILGALGGYFMEWYAMAVDYPINIGGRPLNSWPAYIPITFELMVLCASISAIVGMLALNRLPQPHHPVFNVPEFERASTDRFFLCIEARDPKFETAATRRFLQSLQPNSMSEVAA